MLPHTRVPLPVLLFGWHPLLSSKTLPKPILRCLPFSTPQGRGQLPSPEHPHSQACPSVVAVSRGTCTPFSRAPNHEAWGLGLSYPVALRSSSWLAKLTHLLCDTGFYSPHPVVECWWAGTDVRLGRRAWGAPSPYGPQRSGWPVSLGPSSPASSKHGCPFSLGSLPSLLDRCLRPTCGH